VRITVQLIDAKTDVHLWSEIYDRDISDIFSIESEVAQNVARELKATLTANEKGQIEKSATNNPEAYNLYLQGRFFWNKRTEEGIKRSLEYFEKAVAADTAYALAYAGLADAYFIQAYWGWSTREKGYAKAKEYALRALKIDKNLVEAHATLGWLYCWNEWKWEDSRKELKLATELNPNYANAHQYYSELLDILRENREARRQINLAIELDPFIPVYHWQSSFCFYDEGKFNESLNEWRKLQEIDPDYADLPWYFFYVYVKQNDDLKAVAQLQQIILKDSLTIKYVNRVEEAYNKSGINGLIDFLIELELKKTHPNPYSLAKWYSILNKKEEACNWLEKTMENPPSSFAAINNFTDFDNLRSEPRFQAIIKKMGLSEYQKIK
jgi:tetratricopeptide (TPR) repeat protein